MHFSSSIRVSARLSSIWTVYIPFSAHRRFSSSSLIKTLYTPHLNRQSTRYITQQTANMANVPNVPSGKMKMPKKLIVLCDGE
jgi:hypothetical protein